MGNTASADDDGPREFPGSSILDSAGNALCGALIDVDDDGASDVSDTRESSFVGSFISAVDETCISSPRKSSEKKMANRDSRDDVAMNPTSALFARALVSEVTDNPRTMTPAQMAERERRLLKAQEAARKNTKQNNNRGSSDGSKPVGSMGKPDLLGSLTHALGGGDSKRDDTPPGARQPSSRVVPPTTMQENRAQVGTAMGGVPSRSPPRSQHSITIGLSLSRRHSTLGHPDTVTRQTAFDFNELQDRAYKYVSSTDSSGWLAGGGERGGNNSTLARGGGDDAEFPAPPGTTMTPMMASPQANHKVAAPDTVHIPIIHIDAETPAAVDAIISALARGEVFIPHMAILPEALSVNGVSPPDLVVRFGCERNDDIPPDEWPNWCLEFMHNQLYEYFAPMGARWNRRPFQITLAHKVRWKTVKHMNRYFAHAERVIDAWREKGPQFLDPQLSYIDGGATPEEVARPHGIYLLRNGVPTNYFAPNFDPPYTTKMTRSLLLNVLAKSWDKNRREWTSEPVARLVSPGVLMATMCGCTDPTQGGFIATEVTTVHNPVTKRVEKNTSIDSVTSPELQDPAEDPPDERDPRPDPVPAVSATPPRKVDSMTELSLALEESDLEFEMEKPTDNHEKSPPNNDNTTAGRFPNPEAFSPSSASSPESESVEKPQRVSRYERPPTPERLHSSRSTSPFRSNQDDDGPLSSRSASPGFRSSSPFRNNHEEDAGAPSAATTEMHTNRSAEAAKREMERRSLEKKKKKLEEAQQEEKKSASDDSKSPKVQPTTSKKISPKTKSPKERARPLSIETQMSEEEKKDAGPKFTMESKDKSYLPNMTPEVQRADSATSLEYSIDSSMLGDASTLGGQYFTGDASVASRRKSKIADDASAHTAQTADSSVVVPSDEELFNVGWAKALDPKSGSYYYFTLDRSKIVWDNPLAPKPDPSVNSGSLQSI